MERPSAETFPVQLIRSMRRLDQLGKSLLVVRIDPEQFKTGEQRKDNKTIGIWWSGAEENGDLMLLLAYLLTKSKDWMLSNAFSTVKFCSIPCT